MGERLNGIQEVRSSILLSSTRLRPDKSGLRPGRPDLFIPLTEEPKMSDLINMKPGILA